MSIKQFFIKIKRYFQEPVWYDLETKKPISGIRRWKQLDRFSSPIFSDKKCSYKINEGVVKIKIGEL